jgi:glycosyltransferase involved in cell wall biosynthesis
MAAKRHIDEDFCRIAVLLPCHNEDVAIARTIHDFRASLPNATIYVYDNNSCDGTVAKALSIKIGDQNEGAVAYDLATCSLRAAWTGGFLQFSICHPCFDTPHRRNLRDANGVTYAIEVGDYFRIFRYQGSMAETVPQTSGYQYTMYGFGSAPARYEWNDLPREVLGEGIVINVSGNSSTVLLTYSTIEIYAGDYVEIE